MVAGHWQGEGTGTDRCLMRVAAAWADAHTCRIIRFGDQMNNVALRTEIKWKLKCDWAIMDYCPIAELVAVQSKVTDKEVAALVAEYESQYLVAKIVKKAEKTVPRYSGQPVRRLPCAGSKKKGPKAFTTNFDDLAGLDQLPGLARQRLMAEGYGFGAEGDWKRPPSHGRCGS